MKKKFKYGKAQPVWKCSREIRIQIPNKLNHIYTCTNFGQSKIERWECIKINKDYNFNIMQLIKDE